MPNLNIRSPQPTTIQQPRAQFGNLKPDADFKNAAAKGRSVASQPPGKPMSFTMASVGNFLATPFKALASRVASFMEASRSAAIDQRLQKDWQAAGPELAAKSKVDLAANAKLFNAIKREFGAGTAQRLVSDMSARSERSLAINQPEMAKQQAAIDAEIANPTNLSKYKIDAAKSSLKSATRAVDSALKTLETLKKGGPELEKLLHDTAAQEVKNRQGALRQEQILTAQRAFEAEVATHAAAGVQSARVALADGPGLAKASVSNGARTQDSADDIYQFVAQHFEACSNPAFFTAESTQGNQTILGTALCHAVLDRMMQKVQNGGDITDQDLNDLERVLGPSKRAPKETADNYGVPDPAPLDRDLIAGLSNEQKLLHLSERVFERYLSGAEGQVGINAGEAKKTAIRDSWADPAVTSATDRIALFKELAVSVNLGAAGMGAETMRKGLEAIVELSQ